MFKTSIRLFLLLSFFLLSACRSLRPPGSDIKSAEKPSSEGLVFSDTDSKAVSSLLQWQFKEDPKNAVSPGRGFYSWNSWETDKSLVMVRVVLAKHCDAEILDASVLTDLATRLEDLRKYPGKQAILRVIYADDGVVNSCKLTEAARPELAIKHLLQLAPVIKSHRQDIAYFEAGFYGMWGEWNSEYAPSGQGYAEIPQLRYNLVRALLDNLPKDLMIMIRRPRFHEELRSRVSREELQRLAFHNDCYLASETDKGTYDGGRSAEYWKNYIAENTRKGLPIGGETCEDVPVFTSCKAAMADMKRLGMTYMNTAWSLEVMQRWKDEQCFDKIATHLGYRFVMRSGQATWKTNQILGIDFIVANDGYAPAYQNFEPKVHLIDSTGRVHETTVAYSAKADPRQWMSGEAVQGYLEIQTGALPKGKYEVYLRWQFYDRIMRFAVLDAWRDKQQSYFLGGLEKAQ